MCNPDQILIAIEPTFNMKNPLTPMQILLRASSSVLFFVLGLFMVGPRIGRDDAFSERRLGGAGALRTI